MFLDFGNVDNLSDIELYDLINEKSNYSLSNEDIKCMLNIIKENIKKIDKEKKINN